MKEAAGAIIWTTATAMRLFPQMFPSEVDSQNTDPNAAARHFKTFNRSVVGHVIEMPGAETPYGGFGPDPKRECTRNDIYLAIEMENGPKAKANETCTEQPLQPYLTECTLASNGPQVQEPTWPTCYPNGNAPSSNQDEGTAIDPINLFATDTLPTPTASSQAPTPDAGGTGTSEKPNFPWGLTGLGAAAAVYAFLRRRGR